MARAKQDGMGDREHTRVLPLLMHGDAAFAGQGIVAETMHLSGLHGYRTGGTIHVVVNNQIGFTTLPEDARSSTYATDIAKMVHAPAFHVNGDDAEAVVYVAGLALEYRQRFRKDVVIDLVCYRRWGHNETDEPSYTQPLMYAKIKSHPSVASLYGDKLVREGVVTREELDRLWAEKKAVMSAEGTPAAAPFAAVTQARGASAGGGRPLGDARPAEGRALGPRHACPRASRCTRSSLPFVKKRAELAEGKGDVDWATAESLAWGTLLLEGVHVRLSGQDSQRGTFSQRHAVLHDPETQKEHVPLAGRGAGGHPLRGLRLAALGGRRARLRVRLLGRGAPRARDVGGAVRRLRERRAGDHRPVPGRLGDEVGAAERPHAAAAAWQRGTGPGALERAHRALPDAVRRAQPARRLSLDARVLLPPAPAAGSRPGREAARRLHAEEPAAPSALRLVARGAGRLAASSRCSTTAASTPRACGASCSARARSTTTSLQAREDARQDDVALVRLERLYPFPAAEVEATLARYAPGAQLVWCQEEPRNMGAWRFVRERFLDGDVRASGRLPRYVGRAESASPGAGPAQGPPRRAAGARPRRAAAGCDGADEPIAHGAPLARA